MNRSLFLLVLLICLHAYTAWAQQVKPAFRSTTYPLPRFASLRSDEVNARAGPGKQYPIRYEYSRKYLPVEIILEYGPWRKIRDRDGGVGWVHSALLSGARTAITTGDAQTKLYKKPEKQSPLIGQIAAQSLVHVNECNGTWCEASIKGFEGWILQSALFGVYEDEIFE